MTPRRPAPPPTTEALPVPPEPGSPRTRSASRSLDDLNRDSPFKPVFFPLDSADLDDEGRAVVTANAELMRKYPTWVITVEGHCDERGTAGYNLALGERRAVAVKTYLVSLGIAGRPRADRELRQGVPVRSGARRGSVGEEPPRALCDHIEVIAWRVGRSGPEAMTERISSLALGAAARRRW